MARILATILIAAAHWPLHARVPVWIDASQAPAGAAAYVERAMKTWTDAADGRVTLLRARTRDEAAIRVFFVRSDSVYGETAPRVDPGTHAIVRADIAINADVLVGAPGRADDFASAIVLYLTALHELGHALGLPHSDTFSAIMYRFRRPDDGERYFGAYRRRVATIDEVGSARATGLSDEDVRTLRGLYEAP